MQFKHVNEQFNLKLGLLTPPSPRVLRLFLIQLHEGALVTNLYLGTSLLLCCKSDSNPDDA